MSPPSSSMSTSVACRRRRRPRLLSPPADAAADSSHTSWGGAIVADHIPDYHRRPLMQPLPDAPATAAAVLAPPSAALVVTPGRSDVGQCPPLSAVPATAAVTTSCCRRHPRPLFGGGGGALSLTASRHIAIGRSRSRCRTCPPLPRPLPLTSTVVDRRRPRRRLPWSTRASCGHHGQWWRHLGPVPSRQSWP